MTVVTQHFLDSFSLIQDEPPNNTIVWKEMCPICLPALCPSRFGKPGTGTSSKPQLATLRANATAEQLKKLRAELSIDNGSGKA